MKCRWKRGIERIGSAIKVETAYVAKKVGRGCSHATERRNGGLLHLTGGDENGLSSTSVSSAPGGRGSEGNGGEQAGLAGSDKRAAHK